MVALIVSASTLASAPERLAGAVGGVALDLWDATRELYSVFARTLYYVVRGKRERGATLRQMYEIGNRSLLFVTVTMGCIGMILVYQAGLQTKRVVPDFSLLGATYLELLVRDLAASLGSLMLATRVGAGIAAEIGSMVVTEQVDALRMCAADPIDYLLVPRFLASLLMTAVLIVWGGTVAFAAGALTAYVSFDVPLDTFASISLLDWGDLATGFMKCLAYGAAIPIVSGHAGLSTFGGSEGVGWATTKAVVNSSLAVIVLNLIISAAAFVVFPK
jgi:phospholipid/cholesterol/gamma-HCH transport system permease protein